MEVTVSPDPVNCAATGTAMSLGIGDKLETGFTDATRASPAGKNVAGKRKIYPFLLIKWGKIKLIFPNRCFCGGCTGCGF